MSDEADEAEGSEAAVGGEQAVETVDGMPVLVDVRPVVPAASAVLPGVQAAAVAATGFLAGAATVALLKRHGVRRLSRVQQAVPSAGSGGPVDLLPVRGRRRFVVDVHVIATPGE